MEIIGLDDAKQTDIYEDRVNTTMDSEGNIDMERYDPSLTIELESHYLYDEDEVGRRFTRKKKMSRSYNNMDDTADQAELPDPLHPIAHKFVINHSDEMLRGLSGELNPVMMIGVDYPLFQLGFHHWMHASKNKTSVFDTFKNKKRVYQVVSGYERYIDDYQEAIGNQMDRRYIEQSDEPKILSRAFYKLWEILAMKRLIDKNEKNFRSAHLAEGPGSFIQATMYYRKLFSKHASDDRYYAITIHSENEDSVPELEREFVEYYKKEKKQRFFMHETFSKKEARASQTKDNGDLTISKTIRNFKKDVGDPVDLVTADGGFDWNNENIQEQEAGSLMLAQIATAIAVQKKGGCFVLKMFENFTRLSGKLLLLLTTLYNHLEIIKPLTSRESNSERYIVCTEYKLDRKQSDSLLEKMYQALDQIKQYTDDHQDTKQGAAYLLDIYPNIELTTEQINQMITINTQIANRQFMVINRMISFIDGSNYHGETYQRYRDRQIRLAKHWNAIFVEKKTEDELVEKSSALLKNGIDDSKRLFGKLYGTVEKKQKRSKKASARSPKKKTGRKLSTEASKKKTGRKLSEEASKKKTGRKLSTEASKKTTGRKLSTEASKKKTGRKLSTEASKKTTGRKLSEEASKKTTGRKLSEEASKKKTLVKKT